MSESSLPPSIAELPAKGRFAGQAAAFSIIAPLIALLIDIFVHPHMHNIVPIQRCVELLLLIAGLTSGIIALVMKKKHGSKGAFAAALVGTCVNSLLLLVVPVLILVPLLMLRGVPTTPQGRLDQAMKKLSAAAGSEERFYALDDAAKESFVVGKIDDARKHATELLALAPSFKGDWNYGNAIQDGNLVLGRIAVKDGRIEEAKHYLLEAGKSPGSPQMNSFGPNMSLANDLLAKNERETVLQYFELCRKFWKMDYGKLDQWSQEVKAGKVPAFGANLVY